MLQRYGQRFIKWGRYAFGKSYQHVPQGNGRRFVPGKLEGYFNDLTAKAAWSGKVNGGGVPLVDTDTTENFPFPIAIFQWALGHWDLWLLSGRTDEQNLASFQAAVMWALSAQSMEGGWYCWTGLQRPVSNPFSAMAQGEGLSMLARAMTIDDRGEVRNAFHRAALFLLDETNGLTVELDGRTHLEEYPGGELLSVLNGWIFAIVGVYDAALAGDQASAARLPKLVRDLCAALPLFDASFWSRYDLAGNLASPFYHQLHIDQLRALALVFPQEASSFLAFAQRFESYQGSRINTVRAVVQKVWQKLRQPAIGEMR